MLVPEKLGELPDDALPRVARRLCSETQLFQELPLHAVNCTWYFRMSDGNLGHLRG